MKYLLFAHIFFFLGGTFPCPFSPHTQINALIINTADTVRQRFFLERFLSLDMPVLFVGPTGTGKSAITNSYLLELPRDKYIINNINFSAQTSANQTQDIIFSKLDRSAAVVCILQQQEYHVTSDLYYNIKLLLDTGAMWLSVFTV